LNGSENSRLSGFGKALFGFALFAGKLLEKCFSNRCVEMSEYEGNHLVTPIVWILGGLRGVKSFDFRGSIKLSP
jgi:hypothetical protein